MFLDIGRDARKEKNPHGKKKIDRIYRILVKNGKTIQYGNFHAQIIVTVTKNLVTVKIILAKVTILYFCAIFFTTVW